MSRTFAISAISVKMKWVTWCSDINLGYLDSVYCLCSEADLRSRFRMQLVHLKQLKFRSPVTKLKVKDLTEITGEWAEAAEAAAETAIRLSDREDDAHDECRKRK